ncbi:Membrane-associated, eicosanoid and glutathione metabolism (MAPEG) [mine drainage metagenome]|uniref:Membrane-associated, eicosanoid and glutathione metabolism (MAPEG) n=1 Tax=mine drainage metagenome TaxID=410659 RepID=T1BVV7_9ZZZZ
MNIAGIAFFAPLIRHNLIAVGWILALATLGIVFLAIRVIRLRWRHRTGIGHGNHPDLERAIRAHANAVEYIPLTLLLFLVAALTRASTGEIEWLGAVFLLGRGLHAWGLSRSSGASTPRMIGMLSTIGVMAFLAVQLCLPAMH